MVISKRQHVYQEKKTDKYNRIKYSNLQANSRQLRAEQQGTGN